MTVGRSPTTWLEPGCHPVADGVHRIPLTLPQDGLRAVNVYALETDSGIALIDGGWHRPDTHRELTEALSALGHTPDDIHDVFVTHIHRDHYTFAVELRRRYGCRVHLGAAEAPGLAEITRIDSNVPESSLREVRRAGAPGLADTVYAMTADEPFSIADWEQPDSWLEPGLLPLPGRRIEAVHTPGHTKGHIVFHDRDHRLSFTGDHILPTITPSVGFELGDWELPLAKFLRSLELLVDDRDHTIAPAHGAVGGKIGPRAEVLLAHHALRFGQIIDLLADRVEPVPGHVVAQRLTWTRHDRPFEALDTFNQLIAVCETMAHLDVLVDRGDARVEVREGVEYFSARGSHRLSMSSGR
ncbi:MBL fold metallo-hydrolase [Gordonia sp. KTR9]|uniref:MBL fold metallo-hydrolase n=1 Tax=Gordonia sp. KTR9 TaxID=337191 RepID=UPI00027DE8FB|nr:MBL fold metallo-hydrolase [Gordonia sp. KTR9]AFR51040.1 Zn-dependent hydrolase, including glyoxylase [Gordonia sp. KTR9]